MAQKITLAGLQDKLDEAFVRLKFSKSLVFHISTTIVQSFSGVNF